MRRRRVSKPVPQLDAANAISELIQQLQTRRAALGKVTAKAEGMHDELEAQAKLLTADGADADGGRARDQRRARARGER